MRINGDPKFVHPAVEEALAFGDDDPITEAPEAIRTLARALYDTELGEESLKKTRQVIRLLQEVVRGE